MRSARTMSTSSAENPGEPGGSACPAPIRGLAPCSCPAHAAVADRGPTSRQARGRAPSTPVDAREAEPTVHFSSEGATVRETGMGCDVRVVERSRNGDIACDGAGETPHGRLHIERSTRSTARGGR
jgi:hypothetical protein